MLHFPLEGLPWPVVLLESGLVSTPEEGEAALQRGEIRESEHDVTDWQENYRPALPQTTLERGDLEVCVRVEPDSTAEAILETYRQEKRQSAARVEQKLKQTKVLWRVLTPDILEMGRETIDHIAIWNQIPTWNGLYLTFLRHPDWIEPIDDALSRFLDELDPEESRNVQHTLLTKPQAIFFELGLFEALAEFRDLHVHPRLAKSKPIADLAFNLDDRLILADAKIIGEGQYWRQRREQALQQNRMHWVSSGPGPQDEAQRIISRILEVGKQQKSGISPESIRILLLSFVDWSPTPLGQQIALQQFRNAGINSALDSVFVFRRGVFEQVLENPAVRSFSKLSDSGRDQIRRAVSHEILMP